VNELLSNRPLLALLAAWILAQALKIPIMILRRRTWNWRTMFGPGNMPSSHTAMAAALTTAVAFQEGLSSVAFAVCVALTAFIIYDAAGSRRAATRQARALNRLIDSWIAGNPSEREFERVVEMLGHEPSEVLGGLLLGIALGVAFTAF
jgi:hypothetical protein